MLAKVLRKAEATLRNLLQHVQFAVEATFRQQLFVLLFLLVVLQLLVEEVLRDTCMI